MAGNSVAPEAIAGGADSFMVLREMIRAGMGVAVLPTYLGDSDPGLQPRPDLMPEITVPLWVATYSELSDVPRIRIVRQHLVSCLRARPDLRLP